MHKTLLSINLKSEDNLPLKVRAAAVIAFNEFK